MTTTFVEINTLKCAVQPIFKIEPNLQIECDFVKM